MRAEIFGGIYDRNDWNGTETPSGPGSTQAATASLQLWLPQVVEELGTHAVLDAGCGTAEWVPALPGYVGVDVVGRAIDAAHAAHPDREYRLLDVCTDALPACDLVLCRDALQHLSWADGLAALENFRRAGAAWIIATTHLLQANKPIRTGDWYPINMQAAPFDFGDPYTLTPDGMWNSGLWRSDKHLGVWLL